MNILQQPQLLAATTSDSTFAAGLLLTTLAAVMLALAVAHTISRLRRARSSDCGGRNTRSVLQDKVRDSACCAPPAGTALE